MLGPVVLGWFGAVDWVECVEGLPILWCDGLGTAVCMFSRFVRLSLSVSLAFPFFVLTSLSLCVLFGSHMLL